MNSRNLIAVLAMGFLASVLTSCEPQLDSTGDGGEQQVHVSPLPGDLAAESTIVDGGFVLYAERSLVIGSTSQVTGNIGVRTPLVPLGNGGFGSQLTVADHVKAPGILIAPFLSLGNAAAVGPIYTYGILAQGAGATHGGVGPFPSAMPPIPLAFAQPTNNPVNVAQTNVPLPPGNYGALTLAVNAGVSLSAGTYSFASVSMANGSSIFLTSGPAVVQVAGEFTTGIGVSINFQAGHVASALELLIRGSATIGPNSKIAALTAAPYGTLSLGGGVTGIGSFVAFDVDVQPVAVLTFQNGFPNPLPNQVGAQQLHGYYGQNPNPAIAPLVGPVSPSAPVRLSISLPLRNRQELVNTENAVSDPKNPAFRKYLPLQTLIDSYYPTNTDYASVQTWASNAGFTVLATYPTNMLVDVTAPASTVQQALFANLVYRQRSDGSSFITVDREPSVNLATPLLYISGLDLTFLPTPSLQNGTGPGGFYWGWDYRNAYLGVGSVCSGLTGAGQTVGILSYESFHNSDVSSYITQAMPTISLNPAPPSAIPVIVGGSTFGAGNSGQIEVALDVESVLSMAPEATVTVFEGDFLEMDSTLQLAAATSPPLSVFTSSLYYPWNQSQEDMVLSMSVRGTTVLVASGDDGSGGDPQDNRDYQYQTIVGGTTLTAANPTAISPPAYPIPYYTSEGTWVQGCSGGGFHGTKGGVMNGVGCFNGYPFPDCGPGAQPQPSYQAGVDMSGNGGSKIYRDFPDIAMLGNGVDVFVNGSVIGQSGTSISAPLLAGYVALADQLSAANSSGLLGFLNPVLYDVGKTRGQAAPNDYYSPSFHDIADGINAGVNCAGGFTSVAGYDLNTGWGSPTCTLLQGLGSANPLTPGGYPLLQVHVNNGDDGIRDDSTASLNVFTTASGSSPAFTSTFHPSGLSGWDPKGAVNDFTFPMPSALVPADITSVSFTLSSAECCVGNICCDNWSIAGLDVRLVDPYFTSPTEECVIHKDGAGESVGRLTESSPTVTIPAGGCAPVLPSAPVNPVSQLLFTFGTGGAALGADNEVDLAIFPRSAGEVICPGKFATPLETGILIPSNSAGFASYSQNTVVYKLQSGPIDLTELGTICINPATLAAQTSWDLYGLNVLAQQSSGGTSGPSACLVDLLGSSELLATLLSGVVHFNVWEKTGCP